MSKKFWAVVGTEENMYEPQVEEFDNKRDVNKFCNEFKRDCKEEGYESFIGGVAETEQEREELKKKVQQHRRDEILEKFGEDVGMDG